MKTRKPLLTPITLTAALSLMACLASAQELTNTWNGTAGDLKWSTSGNWTGTTPASTNDTLFLQTGGSTTAGAYGPLAPSNNVVDTSQAVNALTYQNTNVYHVTYIGTGQVLTVGGSDTTALTVGNIGPVDEGASPSNYTTIYGGGTLVVTSNRIVNVRKGSNSSGSHRATLDLSGLGTFNANISQLLIGGDGSGSSGRNYPAGTLMLARTNFLVFTGGGIGLQAGNIVVGSCQNKQTPAEYLYLGQTNAIFANYVLIGGPKCGATFFGFNTNAVMNLVNPTVLFRNPAGTGPMTYWGIGDRSTDSGSGVSSALATADFTGAGGYVDAQASSLYVGHGQGGASGSGCSGALTWTNGIINATTLMGIGEETGTAPGATGTVNVGGAGQLIVGNGASGSYLRLGYTPSGSTGLGKGALNIGLPVAGGSVWVNGPVVEGGGQNDTITVLGGSLKVSGMLGNTNSVPPSPVGGLEFMTLSNATLTFDLGSTPNPASWWQVGVLSVTPPVTNIVQGSSLTPGTFPLLQYASLSGDDGSAFIQPWNTLPPHVNGYFSNDTANSSIDLVITSVSTPKWNGKAGGVNNGNWDINTTANWVPVSGGGGGITYLQYSVPGDSVLFDDSAAGTTTVNLTTNLSPTAITLNNTNKNYTFTGSGSLSGPTGLSKSGAASLTLSNTGTNTFTGAVAINGGKVQIASGANLLPTNAPVTLADDPSAVLDLNNNNQMIGPLAGGGATGGNVTLGTGTLTLNVPYQPSPYVYNGLISGGGMVVVNGSGSQEFTTANSYSGGTLVSGGTLIVANTDPTTSGVGSGSVTVQTNGALQIGIQLVGGGGADGSIAAGTITNNGYVYLNPIDSITFTNLLTGTGHFNIDGLSTSIVTITNANHHSGQTTLGSGAVYITDPGALGTGLTFISENGSALLQLPGGITLTQAVTLDMKTGGSTNPGIENMGGTNILAGPITLNSGGTYWNVQTDAGDLILQGACSIVGGITGGHTLRLFGNGNGEWWGAINNSSGGGGTTAVGIGGPGTWTLWGTSAYTGVTSVGGSGQLNVNGALTGSSSVTVASGSALSGTGTIAGPVSIAAGATLCGYSVTTSGSPSGAPAGRLTVNNTLSLDPSAATILGVSHAGCDQVAGLTGVTLGGTLQVVITGPILGGETFKLFNSAAYSGDFNQPYSLPDLGSPQLSWDYSSVTNGILRVTGTTVPQIQSVALASDNNILLSGIGPTNWTYSILASTNVSLPLSNWVQVGTGTFTAGTFSFHDLHSTNYVQRFYDVVTQSP